MQYHPKLKKAMDDIEKIMTEYDIAGMVYLHTSGYGEHKHFLSPSYSCAAKYGDAIRIKASIAEHGSKEMRNKKLGDTSNMLRTLSLMGMEQSVALNDISENLDKQIGGKHDGGDMTSHTAQNN